MSSITSRGYKRAVEKRDKNNSKIKCTIRNERGGREKDKRIMERGWRGITKEGGRKEREIQKGKERKSRDETEREYTRRKRKKVGKE